MKIMDSLNSTEHLKIMVEHLQIMVQLVEVEVCQMI